MPPVSSSFTTDLDSNCKKKRAASPVPDDWENDDSSEEDVDEEHNRRIWEEAFVVAFTLRQSLNAM